VGYLSLVLNVLVAKLYGQEIPTGPDQDATD